MRYKTAFPVLAALLISACAEKLELTPSSAPAGEIMAGRQIQTPTTYTFDNDLLNAAVDLHYKGSNCWNWHFPIRVGPALAETLRRATSAGFAHATETSNAGSNYGYHIKFDLEEFEMHAGILNQFMSANGQGQASFTVRVSVRDATGNEVSKAILNGEAYSDIDGLACDLGGKAAKTAAEKAIKKLTNEYVYKIINANNLK